MNTLSEILKDVNNDVDLEYAEPTGTELVNRTGFVNKAVKEAADLYQLREFNRLVEINPGSSSAVTLPANFRELVGNVYQLVEGNWNEIPEIDPQEKYLKSTADRYVYILGNPQGRYLAYFNGITANCTLSIFHQAFPSGMATLTDICELTDSTYVTLKTESYILQSRGSDRFAFTDAQATKSLKNYLGRSMKSAGGQVRVAKRNNHNPLG